MRFLLTLLILFLGFSCFGQVQDIKRGGKPVNIIDFTDGPSITNFIAASHSITGPSVDVIRIPPGYTVSIAKNTIKSFSQPYLDWQIDGTLILTPTSDGTSFYWDDTNLGVLATTNYINGYGSIINSNNNVNLSAFFVAAQSGTKYFIKGLKRIWMANTNYGDGQIAMFFQNNGTFISATGIDELRNDNYDITWCNGTTAFGKFQARYAASYGQIWEFTSVPTTAGAFQFDYDLIESSTNGVQAQAQVDFHLVDMVDNIHAKVRLINLGTNRFISSPVAGNGTGILEADRIIKTGTTTNCAIYGQNFTLLNAYVSCDTNFPIVVIGANFKVKNVTIENLTAACTNSIFASSAQTMVSFGSFTNKNKHPNVTVTGVMSGY